MNVRSGPTRASRIVALAALLLMPRASPAQICGTGVPGYQNYTTYTAMENTLLGAGETNGPERGNRVTLVPAAPAVRRIDVALRSYGQGLSTFMAVVRFYANDGPNGSPGTNLWQSNPQFVLVDSGAPLGFSMMVPGIAVPRDFTWTVQLSDRQGDPGRIGASQYHPPTVGAAAAGVWSRTGPGPADWVLIGLAEPPFGARICVDPVPGDVTCDGSVQTNDAAAMVQALLDPAAFAMQFPNCPIERGDMNCDGIVDAADIGRFVACLLTGNCACG